MRLVLEETRGTQGFRSPVQRDYRKTGCFAVSCLEVTTSVPSMYAPSYILSAYCQAEQYVVFRSCCSCVHAPPLTPLMPCLSNAVSAPLTPTPNPPSFRSPEEIRKAFEDAGVDVDSPLPITTTCGSGVTAAVLSFALELAGRKAELSPVYDGSWSEWGSREDLPKSKGSDV